MHYKYYTIPYKVKNAYGTEVTLHLSMLKKPKTDECWV